MEQKALPPTKNHSACQKNDVLFYSFPALDSFSFVKHGFSSRLGGVSRPPYNSMNLSFTRGDSDENVRENYMRICSAIGLDSSGLVLSSQEHNTNIMRVTAADKGKGFSSPRGFSDIDGLITNEKNITLSTLYADCVPLFFVDPVNRAVGVAHSGWKGTVKKIGKVMVERFVEEFSSRPEDLVVGIGPSIGPCCFEIGTEVFNEFKNMTDIDFSLCQITPPRPLPPDKYMVNLWEVNRQILLSAGVASANISVTDLCTKCHNEFLWSHRVEGANRGSSAAIIGII